MKVHGKWELATDFLEWNIRYFCNIFSICACVVPCRHLALKDTTILRTGVQVLKNKIYWTLRIPSITDTTVLPKVSVTSRVDCRAIEKSH